MSIQFDVIPTSMRVVNRWVLWKYELVDGRRTKVPYQTNSKHASSASSLTWTSFDAVRTAYNMGGYDGIGFMLGGGWVGVDFDHIIKDGVIEPEIIAVMKLLDSYSEISPSGEGIHTICQGEFPETGREDQEKGIAVYAKARYFTFTGNRLENYPTEVQHRTDELYELYKKYFRKDEKPKQNTSASCELSDDQIIALAAQAKNGDKFLSLMEGKYEHFLKGDGKAVYPSQSEADLGLCQLIAFYTCDPLQIDRIFRRSKLYRDKWERQDYAFDRTIKTALNRTTERYSGNGLEDILKENRVKVKRSALEEALLFIADRCGSATSTDNQGFNKTDAVFGKLMADKVGNGGRLTHDEYKNVYKMLGKYNEQLVDGQMDIRLIPKEPLDDENILNEVQNYSLPKS
jgi:putative DNA primase/helicase